MWSSDSHSRTAACEEDIILSLRTQLELHQQLCSQFEIDLEARDELVQALTIRLEAAEREKDKHKCVIRSWKKKAVEMEKICRHLEEEVDNSCHEALERNKMDEAKLERKQDDVEVERDQLRRQIVQLERERDDISRLEREKGEVEAERHNLTHALDNAEADLFKLREELVATNEANKEAQHQLHEQVAELQRDFEMERDNFSSEITRLRAHIQQLQKDSAVMEVTIVQLNKQVDQDKEDIDGLNIALESKQQELELVKRKHGATGRTSASLSTAGRPTASAGPPSKVLRTSAFG